VSAQRTRLEGHPISPHTYASRSEWCSCGLRGVVLAHLMCGAVRTHSLSLVVERPLCPLGEGMARITRHQAVQAPLRRTCVPLQVAWHDGAWLQVGTWMRAQCCALLAPHVVWRSSCAFALLHRGERATWALASIQNAVKMAERQSPVLAMHLLQAIDHLHDAFCNLRCGSSSNPAASLRARFRRLIVTA
jgi:hypothetical protein